MTSCLMKVNGKMVSKCFKSSELYFFNIIVMNCEYDSCHNCSAVQKPQTMCFPSPQPKWPQPMRTYTTFRLLSAWLRVCHLGTSQEAFRTHLDTIAHTENHRKILAIEEFALTGEKLWNLTDRNNSHRGVFKL